MSDLVHDHSRWGAGDQMGAANLITAETRLAALRLVNEGRLYDLSQVIETGAPRFPPRQTPYLIFSSATSRETGRFLAEMGATNGPAPNLERVEMTMHVGTHIDALGHFAKGETMYNGLHPDEVVTDTGLAKLGIEQAPPIITRGVCLDVSGLDGGEHLESGRSVTRADLERVLEKAGLELQAGDMVCIHTGWGRFFMTDNDRYTNGEPGIDEEAARWLTGQDVVAIGCDNMAVEVMPNPQHPKVIFPVHLHTLVEAGVYLVENMMLSQLAREGVTAFCLILLPVKFKGATGCPVRPVAMI
ncbi:MAG: cyclase family protein [SAR324 cluster bacterium]|nr:cyclase family protein [SAR324 cluster bacterium]